MKRQRYAKCRHFTGIQNKTCKVGISYESVRDESARPYGFPCLLSGGKCERCSPLTDEEQDARDCKIASMFANIALAREAIITHANGQRGIAGVLPCPVCNAGTLHYSIAKLNGHIHAKCETKDCVGWME